ncbi:hypothetical protein E2I00_004122, partial [Balaenoptera physalus]
LICPDGAAAGSALPSVIKSTRNDLEGWNRWELIWRKPNMQRFLKIWHCKTSSLNVPPNYFGGGDETHNTTKAFLPTMLEINHGHIVTVASSLGLFSTAGVESVYLSPVTFYIKHVTGVTGPGQLGIGQGCEHDYCASKFGVVGFHESLSHELKAAEKDGIKTTLVCPYLVDTGMFRGCRIRKEIEPFLPPLKPDYCVKQAMKAILTDQPMICTPRLMYIVTFMKSILPFEAVVCMYRFLGADKCMYPFIAQRKQATNNNEAKNGI